MDLPPTDAPHRPLGPPQAASSGACSGFRARPWATLMTWAHRDGPIWTQPPEASHWMPLCSCQAPQISGLCFSLQHHLLPIPFSYSVLQLHFLTVSLLHAISSPWNTLPPPNNFINCQLGDHLLQLAFPNPLKLGQPGWGGSVVEH